jgi:hypothetical protein
VQRETIAYALISFHLWTLHYILVGMDSDLEQQFTLLLGSRRPRGMLG